MKQQPSIESQEPKVLKLIDYILLNAYSVNSTGLHNGKAGIALALFESARHLQNDYLEERACELLEESLLSKNEHIGFEEGLSGIGYGLLYLIENELVEADFETLFANHLNRIMTTVNKWVEQQTEKQLFKHQSIALFLAHIPNKSREVVCLIKQFADTVERVLSEQLCRPDNIANPLPKINMLYAFRNYLKLVSQCSCLKPSFALLNLYTKAYQQGKFVSDFPIGYYLDTLPSEVKTEEIKTTAEANRYYAIHNTHADTLPLSERLNLLYLLSQYKEEYTEQKARLEKGLFDGTSEAEFEQCLSRSIPPDSFVSGYGKGVTKFLLYHIYRQQAENQQDCTRFKNIF